MANVPDFRWAAFYYPEMVAALLAWKAEHWPEHTETDPHDPVVQMLRAMGLVGHIGSVRLDHAARELYWPTLRLRASAVALAPLYDYAPAPPAPAEVDLLADLTAGVSSTTTVLRAHSLQSNRRTSGDDEVIFEYVSDDDLQVEATGTWDVVADDGGTLATQSLPMSSSPWAGGLAAGDALYFGHASAQFDGLAITLSQDGTALDGARWEYFDDSRVMPPDAVSTGAGTITVDVDTLVGSTDATGLQVVVTCLRTGQSETLTVAYSGGNSVTTTGTLGQSTVSTSAADYEVSTSWPELPTLLDGTNDGTAPLRQDGGVSWALPQGDARRWAPTEVNGSSGYWIRCRVTDVDAGDDPVVSAVAEHAGGTTWTVLWEATQGRRVEETLGSTDGTPSQRFTLARTPFLALVRLTVGGDDYEQVSSFLSSSSTDRHFTLLEQPDGSHRVELGDGTRGRLPSSSQQVVITYRIGGGVSGNLGPGAIIVDRSGNGRLRNVRNPRAATGWVAQEGSTPASLQTMRQAVPASLRTLDRAVTPEDTETLAVAFRSADGDQVAERALAIEEGNGLKTVALVCVGPGGEAPTVADLAELSTHFNGEAVGVQRVGGLGMANHETTAEAYVPRAIAVTATVNVLSAYASGAEARIKAALQAALQPTAKRLVLDDDGAWVEGTEYQWSWEDEVSLAVLLARIVTAQSGVTNVALTVPAADITLAAKELPVPGAIVINVVAV